MNAPAHLDPSSAGGTIDTRFTIPGIRCAGCIATIERGLGKCEGVETARVNLSTKRVAVRHAPTISESGLVEALRQLGFEAQATPTDPLAADDGETRKLQRALAVAGFGMMNIMLLSVSVWAGAQGATRELFHWFSALIALPVVGYSGRVFFSSAWSALRHRRTNMDVPISIGVLMATGLSLYETIAGGGHAYFDSALMLLFFLLVGRALDAEMRTRTRAGIGAMLSRMGRSAQVIEPNGNTRAVSANKLERDMLMLVAAGEALAADGVVEIGSSMVDAALLTGESTPERVAIGSQVHAGMINLANPLQVRVTAAADDTAIAEIARLMEEAGQSRSQYTRIADRAARLYAPVVHTLALLAFVAWILMGAGWYQSLVVAIAVLIITCPCAMGLAVPAAQVVASGTLIRNGLLVKDGSALERLAEVDLAIFDKTGTLTSGWPQADITALDEQARQVALALAQASRHPLSEGLAEALRVRGTVAARIDDLVEESGLGVRGVWQGMPVALEKPESESQTLAVSLRIGERRLVLNFADALREDTAETIEALRDLGIESRILSGDRASSVAEVADILGLQADAECTPQEKLTKLERLHNRGHRVLMIGDGINDGPALAAAHASIAPGSASDVSQQAADAVFTGGQLRPVALAIRVARATQRIVRQNFAFAVVYNLCAIPLALAGYVTPLLAAVAMSASSIVVVGNSLRLAGAAR